MKQKTTLFILAMLFAISTINAQHVELKQVVPQPFTGISGHSSPNGSCDTLNIYDAGSWSAYYYDYRGGGSVLGTNNLTATKDATILEDANFFDVNGSDYNFISGGLVYFSYANSTLTENLNKDVVFKIYDDASGLPGTLLSSVSIPLSQVHQDVLNGKLTEFKLGTPIAVPASGKFYVSVDHSNFEWKTGKKDSIAIVATDNHATANKAFQYIKDNNGNSWMPVPDFWRNADGSDSLDVTLFIFPYLQNSLTSCEVLAVSMYNFGGFVKDNKAYLNWSTATESNNKGFYVERSKDGRNFSSIGFVKGAGNSSQVKNYTFTDDNLKSVGTTTTYYRLKQVDLDEKANYSNVIALNLKDIVQWRVYPNPVKDVATIELNLTTSSKVNLQVISRDGKIVLNSDKGLLNAGVQQIYFHTQGLAKGSYIIKVKAGTNTYTMPIIKE
ncbi:MAG: T9SS type A sorting domain-containing protein [Bacteroidetes bacterium]|nr:T9SS type A sorting domain-containing protein [Bacteroidota bacterium]